MIGETINLERAAHTANGYSLVGSTRTVTVMSVVANSKGGSPQAAVWWPGCGLLYFALNSGWGEKGAKEYRIALADLDSLRAHARGMGFKVNPTNSAPSERRKGARRPKNAPQEQLTFLGA